MKLSDFIRGKMAVALTAVITVSALSSCGMIYEDEGDCNTYCDVRFVYDRNMEFADAFASKVEAVDLYVFDADGKRVERSIYSRKWIDDPSRASEVQVTIRGRWALDGGSETCRAAVDGDRTVLTFTCREGATREVRLIEKR